MGSRHYEADTAIIAINIFQSDTLPFYTFLFAMKLGLIALLLTAAASTNAYSDAVKYRQPNGQILITNQGAGEGAKEISAARDEYIPPSQRQAAQADLERQRAFLQQRERENRPAVTYTGSTANSGKDVSVIYACLMKVTATFGLTPGEEARRKVRCYSGTVGMNDDCQRSVAATMRLTSNEERAYKSQCPS